MITEHLFNQFTNVHEETICIMILVSILLYISYKDNNISDCLSNREPLNRDHLEINVFDLH